ncbi:MAG TPA: 3-hydroxy-2-methylbutyryl-CoA dehydrogenase, partial [Erythrobacter sp.]|nr:3-hydroxy-2-methylbutyryl-CoA dehydrogenase [Erythrobacter sp.]
MELTQGMAAVVTGGASGLGKASAQALADLGLKVTIFDVNEEAGEAHAQAIGGTFARVDITDEQSVVDGFAAARAAHG